MKHTEGRRIMDLKSMNAAVAIAVASVLAGMDACGDSLRDNLINPPESARPHTWWHWMNGNVSKEGITADLEAMKANGITGANIFAGGNDVPAGPVRFGSDEWYDCFRWAAKEYLGKRAFYGGLSTFQLPCHKRV